MSTIRLKALILLDGTVCALGKDNTRIAENYCHGMKAKVHFHYTGTVYPTTTQINVNFSDYDLIVIPAINSSNRTKYERFLKGAIIVAPVFVLMNSYVNTSYGGVVTNNWADDAANWYTSNIYSPVTGLNTGKPHCLTGRRMRLASVSGIELVAPILAGGDKGTRDDWPAEESLATYKYSPNLGTSWVYINNNDIGTNGQRNIPFHLMLEHAINDGMITKPALPTPFIFIIDHINDGGDAVDGDNNMGGWQENPEPLKDVCELLRANKGICYTNIERQYENGTKSAELVAAGQPATGNPTLHQYLRDYQDVLKFNPYHDHSQPHNTGAVNAQSPVLLRRSKADIDASIQATLTSISNLGLTPEFTLGHFANDRSNEHLWQLCSPQVSKMSSIANDTVQAGYGMKLARISDSFESWPQNVRMPGNKTGYQTHWFGTKTKHRGILMVTGADGGTSRMSTLTHALCPECQTNRRRAQNIDYVLRYMHVSLMSGLLSYYHAADFEDVAWRTANLPGAPVYNSHPTDNITETFTQTALEYMAGYCSECPQTVKFGADINNYIK